MNNMGVKARLAGAFLASMLIGGTAAAQDRTNIPALQAIARRASIQAAQDKAEAVRIARLLGIPIKERLRNGAVRELMRFVGSVPVYYQTDNLGAARTVGADKVWPGGPIGFNVSGAGLTLGEWDEGCALLTHQEFGGRVSTPDGAGTAEHSTHVAGTIMAAGVDPNAKGMSFQANLHCFDWDNDTAEMAAAAAAGLLVSNHSYSMSGPGVGYIDICAQWDDILYNAPYYQICKSAGNWGPDASSITAPSGAKNTITCGAIEKNPTGYSGPAAVKIADFSSRGPMPDGRIKPDIVAPGVDLYSCSPAANNAYELMSGTSMATPCTTGNMGLIISYYEQTHPGTDMRASTLKALAIHTADEAGPADGPDYDFGWGQLDTLSACCVIRESLTNAYEIQENQIADGETFTYTVNSDGVLPMKVTICWTDPAGPTNGTAPDPVLVNDLDLRVDNGSTTYKPWVLDVNNPTAPATTGDNNVDNVEQVVFQPAAGPCVITVKTKHGAHLLPSGTQRFSMIVTGVVAPTITSFSVAPTSISTKDVARGNLALDLPAPSGGAQVKVTCSPKGVLTIPGTVRILPGMSTGTFDVVGRSVLSPTIVNISAQYGKTTLTSSVTVVPSWIIGFTLNPTTVGGGATTTGTVTLGKPAPAGGALVTLASSDPTVATTDWKLVVPEGAIAANFTVHTIPVDVTKTVRLSAAYPGPTMYADLSVTPTLAVQRVSMVPQVVRGGGTATGTVVLTMVAPNDLTVTLSSSDASVATVPATVTVKKGSRTATFAIATKRVKAQKTVSITGAFAGFSQAGQLKVNP